MSVRALIAALVVALLSIGVAAAAEGRSTADVDSARFTEFSSIFGVVAGYTVADHNAQVWHEGDAAAGEKMDEGAKCGMEEGGNCCCKSKCCCKVRCCKPRCGCNSCHKSCGCNSCGHKDCGCKSHSCGCNKCCHHWDCWGVSEEDPWNFAATRDSDYDPVMGRGDTGGSFFGWHGW
jgi:hypothetical protein